MVSGAFVRVCCQGVAIIWLVDAHLFEVCVCVDLSSGQGRSFPILRLTKGCWTYLPPLGT
jgi:hypothetical protein